jgi:cob(I)alamin adenosyltransferase
VSDCWLLEVFKNAPEERLGLRQLAASFAFLSAVPHIFKGESKLAYSKGFAIENNFTPLARHWRPYERERMNRTLIFTGEGKGKTTAALGTVLRAAGHGRRSLIIQFVKSDDTAGELAACKFLPGVEIVQMGCGFIPNEKSPEYAKHREAALNALAFAEQAIDSGNYPLIVLDEICVAVAKNLIEEDRVVQLLQHRDKTSCIILTGRGASERLIQKADTVTEMRCLGHAFQHGMPALEGVEY